MNNIVKRVFDDSMKREGKTIRVLYTGSTFTGFFRRNNDSTNQEDTMILYYPIDAPVRAGNIITFANNQYILLNKETAENETYFKSAVMKTNGIINTHNLSVSGLPFYGDGLNNALADDGNYISLVNGNVKIITEDCQASRSIEINDKLNEWGRTFRVENIYYIDGIAHLVLQVDADLTPEYEYTLSVSQLSQLNVKPNDTDTISAMVLVNGEEFAGATVSYTSSNNEVAAIDQSGNITYLAEGEVYFTVSCATHNLTYQTETVTVAAEPVNDEVGIYVQSIDELSYDFPETLTYYATRGGVRDDTIPVSFKIENLSVTSNYNVYLKKITVTDNGNNTIDLEASGSIMVNKTFDLVAYNDEYQVENRQNIKIVSMF